METIKNWVFESRFFNIQKRNLYTKTFSDALKDLEETNVYNTEEKAKELADKMINDLLTPVDLNKILTINKEKGFIFVGGVQVDDIQAQNLKAEAEFMTQSEIWKVLYASPKSLAESALFRDDGKSEVLHAKGRAILYVLDTQKKIIDTLMQVKKR